MGEKTPKTPPKVVITTGVYRCVGIYETKPLSALVTA